MKRIKENTFNKFLIRAREIWDDRFDYSQCVYDNYNHHLKILCRKHNNLFEQLPSNHLKYNGCEFCCTEEFFARQAKNIIDNKNNFIEKSNKVHYNKFNYDLIEYINNLTKIIIICPTHGEFAQTPGSHTMGNGCPKCAREERHLPLSVFIDRCNEVHNNKYDYSRVILPTDHKVIIICPLHGEFKQKVDPHSRGKGCPRCGRIDASAKLADTLEDFISKSNKIHDNKYDYSLVDEKEYKEYKVTIICPKHGNFSQTRAIHVRGHGCPKCVERKSKSETKWLDSLSLPNDQEHRQVFLRLVGGKYIWADGFDPKTNTIYEFYGSYWHGDPEFYNKDDYNAKQEATFGELYQKTINREDLIKRSGYNLITIWSNKMFGSDE